LVSKSFPNISHVASCALSPQQRLTAIAPDSPGFFIFLDIWLMSVMLFLARSPVESIEWKSGSPLHPEWHAPLL
jgi:hypothetical protein